MENLARRFAFVIAQAEQPRLDFFQSRARANGLYIGSRVESDHDFESHLCQLLDVPSVVSSVKGDYWLRWIEKNFADWIGLHGYNRLHHLDLYQPSYSEGSTQAFDSFYLRHRNRRFRSFVGEYFYHMRTWQANKCAWSWTDGRDLEPNDALIISQPFCDTVAQWQDLDDLLERCCELDVPVLLDLCYYVISHGLDINLDHACIDTVAFSLSKAWPISTARIGMRFTRTGVFDGQQLHSSIGYNNNLGAYIGSTIMQHYRPDWVHQQHQDRYPRVLDVLGLKGTNSVCFGIGDHNWQIYSRRELLRSYGLDFDPALFVNRICLNKIYQHWPLFRRFIKDETGIEI